MMANNTNRTKFILPECIMTYRKDILQNGNGTVLTIFYAMIAVFIIIVNILLIVGLVKTKKKTLTQSSKLFICLCASDLLVGFILMPLQIYYLTVSPDISCLEVAVRAFWNPFPLVLSGSLILLISVDRYLMIVKTTFYHKYFKNIVVIVVIAAIVVISFFWGLGYALVTQKIQLKPSAIYFLCLSVFETFILAPTMILNLLLKENVHEINKNSTLQLNKKMNHDRRLSRTIMLIAIALCICYIPSVIGLAVAAFFYLYSSNRDHLRYITIALIWSLVVTTMNSGLNACIYIITNSRVRKYLKAVLYGATRSENEGISMSTTSRDTLKINRTVENKQTIESN